MSVDPARSASARKKVSDSRAWPAEVCQAEGLLQILGEMAVEIAQNVRKRTCGRLVLDNHRPVRGMNYGMEQAREASWDEVVKAAYAAYASGLFGLRDIHIAVNAALIPVGVHVLPKHARDALDDLESANRVVPAHIRERVAELRRARTEETTKRLGDGRGKRWLRNRRVVT